jgi:hypothetical protein
MIRTVNVSRYITPLREGGSLPAIVEADDGFNYVLKFRGAGQGTKALIADFLGAEIARRLGLNVPELVLADLSDGFGITEADEEIQDLLKFSTGINLGVHYLSGAITYDPVVKKIEGSLASKIVWLDAFLMNIDRTAKNTNLLIWNKELWLIDHGAALYFHHNPESWKEQSTKPFFQIKDHVLLGMANDIKIISDQLAEKIDKQFLISLINKIPDDWFATDKDINKELYFNFISQRLENRHLFENQAEHERLSIV